MNVERMLKLADALEAGDLPVEFNMADFDSRDYDGFRDVAEILSDPCGTACCIGETVCEVTACRLLDLTPNQASQLFYNGKEYIVAENRFADITRNEAAAAIRRMVAEEAGPAVMNVGSGSLNTFKVLNT